MGFGIRNVFPPINRLTLRWSIDLALQGRLAERVGTLVQRLKSVELVSQGGVASGAESIEVLPPEHPVVSSREEAEEAIREQKEEQRTRNEAEKNRGKGDQWQWRDCGHKDREKART